MDSFVPVPSWVPGRLIGGRYRVEERLGRGAMGAVYRVLDERSSQRVALKRMRPPRTLRRELARAHFEREYHVLAGLAHPRIIEVYDYGLDGDTPFYTMELLDGADLRARGQLPWREACALLCDVASCLAILHSRRMVHRDVSARNVRRTSDGRAKLLDFGGMAPMGVVQEVIGTPPHVPPEAVQRQALDARADIFSLGVLGYYMLTGRYPYPATLLTELADVWRTTPHRVRELAGDVPEALSDLIGQMIQLNRMSRPASAAEVMERLCAIAAFPLEDHAEVRRAYLTTPGLVGRERACARIRERLLTATHGHGCPIWIEGAAGSGRSRLLEAAVLESKLLGMAALRVAASEAPAGDYGVMRALCADVLELCPELARQCAHFHGAVLASVIDGLEPEAARAEPPARRQLQIALRDFWLAVARQQPLLIAVDDFDRIDEPSAAVLAALAHRANQRGLVLAVTAETRTERAPALTLLREASVRIELTPLSVEDTEALIRSVFGDADHSVLVARRIHELSEGNPRAAMAVAEHLVDSGLARYASGGWLLPQRRTADDLPASVAEALQSRLRGLGADARELADLLALAQDSAFDPSRLAPLFADGDAARAYRAVGELLTSGVLAADGERYKFAQRALPGVLVRRMTQARRRDLHARLAALSEQAHETTWQAHHLFECGDEHAAVQLLLEHRRAWRSAPHNVAPLLDAALHAAQRVALTRRARCELLMWRLTVASAADDVRAFHLHLPELCAELRADSGLADFEGLGDAVPPDARLERALALAQGRHDDLPERERGHEPFKAIQLLSRLSLMTSGVAAVAFDLDLIERLPSLAPLAPVLPAIEVVMLMVEATRSVLQGRSEAGHQIYHRALALLDRPDRAGMSPAQHRGLRLGIIYTLGLLEAALGRVGSLELIRELDDAPDFRANAYRVRAVSHFMLGDASAAVECQRQAELLQLQEDGGGSYFGSSWNAQLIARRLMDDLTGVKRALDAITELCRLYPCWLPILHWARYEYLRIQGDHTGALAAIESALAISAPARCVNWPQFAEAHVQVMLELDRPAQALAYAERYAATCDELKLAPSHRALWGARGMALVKLGRHAEGLSQLERSVREYEQIGVRGLIAGHYYEQRARAAIWMKDGPGFRRWAERAANEYQRGRNAALAARYARLVQEAERAGLVHGTRPMPSYPPGPVQDRAASDPRTAGSTVHARMAACQGSAARAHCALEAIVDACSAQCAHLYGVQAGRLTVLAVLGEAESPEIGIILAQQLSAELCADPASAVTVISAARTPLADADRVLEREGRVYRARALQVRHEGEPTIVAMLALGFVEAEPTMPPAELLGAIASALLAGQDVDPLTCIASTMTS